MYSPKKPYLAAALVFAMLFVGMLVVFVARQSFAWTNPTSNPPFSTSAITTSGGNVGIGTTAPTYKLSVNGALGPGNNTRSDGGYGGIDFTNNGIGYQYSAKIYTFRSDASGEYYGLTNDYDGNGAQLSLISKQAGGNIGFYTGDPATRKMAITASGNVGIGTTAPNSKLDVNGSGHFSSDLTIDGSLIYGSSGTRTEYRDDAGAWGDGIRSGFYQASSPVNFPAGASSWWHLLDVRHSNPGNNYAMQFAGSFFDQNLYFRKTNNNGAQPWVRILTTADATGTVGGSGTANYLSKWTTGSALGNSSIYDNGNVGIGTTAPGYKLDVSGSARVTGAVIVNGGSSSNWGGLNVGGQIQSSGSIYSYDSVCVGNNSGNCDSTGGVVLGRGNGIVSLTTGTSYFNGGNVGIGTTVPGYKLDVVGDIRAQNAWLRTTGNTGWYSDTWGGGWYMQDSSWIRGYNNKSLWMGSGLIGGDGGLTIGYGGAGSPSGGAIIGGNVGIGTVSPDARLAVTNTAAGTAGLVVHGQSGDTWFPYTDGKNYIRGTTIIADGAGNVGIGTAGPAYKLDVAGSVRSSSGGFVFPDGTTQTTAASASRFGGAYSAFFVNPQTGGYSCPAGYAGIQMSTSPNSYICQK